MDASMWNWLSLRYTHACMHERLPDEYKSKLAERFKQYSDVLTGQIGLHGYFILLADTFLKDGGRLALDQDHTAKS